MKAAKNTTLDDLAAIADEIHICDTQDSIVSRSNVAACNLMQTSAEPSIMQNNLLVNLVNAVAQIPNVISIVSQLTQEVAALKSTHCSRSMERKRSNSPRPYRQKTPRGASSFLRHTKIVNNQCWYHYKYDADAK